MRSRIIKKLKSSEGISILYALLMFIVAAVVCAIIIAAALTSVKAVRNDFDEEQAFLTVESAEKLIEADINGGSLVFEKVTTTPCDKDKKPTGSSSVTERTDSTGLKDICRETLTNMVLAVKSAGTSQSRTGIKINAADSGEASDRLCAVEMTINMDTSYQIRAAFMQDSADELNTSRTNPIITVDFDCSEGTTSTSAPQYYKTSGGYDKVVIECTTYTWTVNKVTNVNRD